MEYKHYILGGSGAVAIRTLRAGTSSVNDTRYLHKDHLGSLDVITDESGGVIARLSYDAFGNRRNGATWSGAPTSGEWSAIAAVTHRGFTFHEHLDHLEAIHMNGRVFDPKLGRFLSADPFIQSPGFSQSFNRYSYTFNNPLSYTDPSGYLGRPAQSSPDDQPPAVLPNVQPYPSPFPDWPNRVNTHLVSIRHGLKRIMCNRNPDSCDRIVRSYQRVHGYSGSTVGGLTVFAVPNEGFAARPYTTAMPSELTKFFAELDPYFVRLEQMSGVGEVHEEGLLTYRMGGTFVFNSSVLVPARNNRTGTLELGFRPIGKPGYGGARTSRALADGGYSGRFPAYAGATLFLTAHTHPFPSAPEYSFFKRILCGSNCVSRQPSALDIGTSRSYPDAYHLILGQDIFGSRLILYYGDKADIK